MPSEPYLHNKKHKYVFLNTDSFYYLVHKFNIPC
jgi:hypothetical protein